MILEVPNSTTSYTEDVISLVFAKNEDNRKCRDVACYIQDILSLRGTKQSRKVVSTLAVDMYYQSGARPATTNVAANTFTVFSASSMCSPNIDGRHTGLPLQEGRLEIAATDWVWQVGLLRSSQRQRRS